MAGWGKVRFGAVRHGFIALAIKAKTCSELRVNTRQGSVRLGMARLGGGRAR